MFKRRSKEFYQHALMIAVPIMIQNGITNFVSMLDNVMVGRVGTDPMSGVAISNQLLFVWNLVIFGGLAGAGIFAAQFQGKGDTEGVRHTFRMQLYIGVVLLVAALAIYLTAGDQLIRFYLHADGGEGNAEATFAYAKSYLLIMLWEFAPFVLSQVYANTLKSIGETVLPMQSSLIAVTVNLIGNYILIYGKFGVPQLGVNGAAIATVIARFVELGFLVYMTHKHSEKYPFIQGVYRNLRIPADLVKKILSKGLPLLVNETLWGAGVSMLAQRYALRGLSVVAAYNISSTLGNVMNVGFIAIGYAVGIIIGQELGKGKKDTVMDDALHLAWFSVVISFIFVAAMIAISPFFPMIYNTSAENRALATDLIRIFALAMPIDAMANALYFILRSGGKTFIAFLFDSCFSWLVQIPIATVLIYFTDWRIQIVYACVLASQLLKSILGYIMVKKGIWINDLTR